MSGDLEFCIKYYGRAAFVEWLDRCYSRLFAHGEELVRLVEGADNVYRAERLLSEAERAGWIKRGEYCPSISQQFFGVGGSDVGQNGNGLRPYPSCWGWVPGQAHHQARAWLDSAKNTSQTSTTEESGPSQA